MICAIQPSPNLKLTDEEIGRIVQCFRAEVAPWQDIAFRTMMDRSVVLRRDNISKRCEIFTTQPSPFLKQALQMIDNIKAEYEQKYPQIFTTQ